jgi:hypothetical protein
VIAEDVLGPLERDGQGLEVLRRLQADAMQRLQALPGLARVVQGIRLARAQDGFDLVTGEAARREDVAEAIEEERLQSRTTSAAGRFSFPSYPDTAASASLRRLGRFSVSADCQKSSRTRTAPCAARRRP